MSAAERNKGAFYERKAVAWLRANGHEDARRYLAGDGRQPGDLDAIPGYAIDVKARRDLAIPMWLRQVEAEAGDKRVPVLWVHRPGLADVGDWWWVSRVRHMMPLLEEGLADAPDQVEKPLLLPPGMAANGIAQGDGCQWHRPGSSDCP